MFRYPIPATDIIIEYCGRKKPGYVSEKTLGPNNPAPIVLIERNEHPFGLAIPGGILEKGLTLEQNAKKEAKEETNLDVILLNPNRPFSFSDPLRDPRAHIISLTFFGIGYGNLKAGDDAKHAMLYSVTECISLLGKNRLVFDHENILKTYLKHKRYI